MNRQINSLSTATTSRPVLTNQILQIVHNRMTDHPHDNAGIEIKVGSRVAFNRSGSVELGVVVGLRPLRRYGHASKLVVVKCDRDGLESKIRNQSGVAVLRGNVWKK